MPTSPCLNKITCECDDDPISNYSAEAPDAILYRSIGNVVRKPPLGWSWTQLGCRSLCESSVSQLEADLCATRQALECIIDGPLSPPGTPPSPECPPGACVHPVIPAATFVNQRQECSATCADGQTFTYVVAAGTIAALTQATADAQAFALACQQAGFQKVCFSSARNLQEGCKNTSYSTQVIATGGIFLTYPYVSGGSLLTACQSDPHFVPYSPLRYSWTLVSGSLPPGLTLRECTGYIDGTPTAAGTYTFTLKATDRAGNYQTKEFQICIFEITSTSPLPSGEVNTAYSQSLSSNPSPAVEEWAVIAGTLPPGLTLDQETGIISGTPTTAGTYNFTVMFTAACA
jgi:large repetitive protein